jgi:hypothetical protein
VRYYFTSHDLYERPQYSVDCNQSVAELSRRRLKHHDGAASPDSRVRTVKFLFAPRERAWGYPLISVKIIDVRIMGYCAYQPYRFDSYEISMITNLFAPMSNFAALRAFAVIS